MIILAGFYFPDTTAVDKYYNGSILEEEYEKKLMVNKILLLTNKEPTINNSRIFYQNFPT